MELASLHLAASPLGQIWSPLPGPIIGSRYQVHIVVEDARDVLGDGNHRIHVCVRVRAVHGPDARNIVHQHMAGFPRVVG